MTTDYQKKKGVEWANAEREQRERMRKIREGWDPFHGGGIAHQEKKSSSGVGGGALFIVCVSIIAALSMGGEDGKSQSTPQAGSPAPVAKAAQYRQPPPPPRQTLKETARNPLEVKPWRPEPRQVSPQTAIDPERLLQAGLEARIAIAPQTVIPAVQTATSQMQTIQPYGRTYGFMVDRLAPTKTAFRPGEDLAIETHWHASSAAVQHLIIMWDMVYPGSEDMPTKFPNFELIGPHVVARFEVPQLPPGTYVFRIWFGFDETMSQSTSFKVPFVVIS